MNLLHNAATGCRGNEPYAEEYSKQRPTCGATVAVALLHPVDKAFRHPSITVRRRRIEIFAVVSVKVRDKIHAPAPKVAEIL